LDASRGTIRVVFAVKHPARVAAWVIVGLVLAAGLGYLALIGLPLSPTQQHDRALLWDIDEAHDWIDSYYQQYTPSPDKDYRFPGELVTAARASGHWGNRLPPSLLEAARIDGVDRQAALRYVIDPASNDSIVYRPTRGSAYSLCATFRGGERFEGKGNYWSHPAGVYCFTFDARQPSAEPMPRFTNAWLRVCDDLDVEPIVRTRLA